jgi:hypothetical protein
MEYIIGIAIGIASVILVASFRAKSIPVPKKLNLVSSQSRTYQMLKPAFAIMAMVSVGKPLITQATKYMQTHSLRFLTMDNQAYWIKDNTVFVSDVLDGDLSSINESTTRVVDMMTLDKVELDKMIFIVEKLTEGLSNDSSNSGN